MKQAILNLWQENGTLSMINQTSAGNEIIYRKEVLKSNLCDYNDAYILVRGDIIIIGRNLATNVAFKNCVQVIKYIA